MGTEDFKFAEVFSYESLVHAVAGAMGSVTAMTVFFPLDTARLRLQGVVNVLVTTPLWVVNTRLKLQGANFRNADIRPTQYSGMIDAFVQIVRQEGLWSLWNGTFPSLLLVLNPAIQFMIYEGLKRQLRRGGLSAVEVFLIGAVSKAVATTVTYPLQTVQSVLRFGQHRQPTEHSQLLSSLRSMTYLLINRVRKYGMLGLFKGLEAKLLQTVLTAALMFLLYEKIASLTFRVMGVKSPNYRR
ncbi:peroxisomal membrane protein PMP34 isoform X3 [Chanos chanos]|uniref:Peroxisomal membrane protein PMP34 isoform X3 n=1 Tax=Chanos chanos TaxID=29144 RepID=A0A6J2WZH2_CHACN|nr:peroxisomal membrane protein PMP34 isoform X3 [Chanos chanos]